MFNLKKARSNSKDVAPYSKSLQKNRKDWGSEADDKPSITQIQLGDQRKGELEETTEAQFDHETEKQSTIIEKNFEHKKIGELYVPAINALVEKTIQERRKDFVAAQNSDKNHWSLEAPTQNKSLPAWPKINKQPDKLVVPGDVNRKPNEEALIGGKILKASVNDVVSAIKNGETKSIDREIVSILKTASDESRDLNDVEKQKINQLKINRSRKFLGE